MALIPHQEKKWKNHYHVEKKNKFKKNHALSISFTGVMVFQWFQHRKMKKTWIRVDFTLENIGEKQHLRKHYQNLVKTL